MFSRLALVVSVICFFTTAPSQSQSDPADLNWLSSSGNVGFSSSSDSSASLPPLDQSTTTTGLFDSAPLPLSLSGDEVFQPFGSGVGTSGSLFGGTQPGDSEMDFASGDFEFSDPDFLIGAACSLPAPASESYSPALTTVGKSRRRQRSKRSGSCANSNAGNPPPPNAASDLEKEFGGDSSVLSNPLIEKLLDAAQGYEDHNTLCYVVSLGTLPWGVCSSGNPLDVETADRMFSLALGSSLMTFDLAHGWLGTFTFLLCLFLSLFGPARETKTNRFFHHHIKFYPFASASQTTKPHPKTSPNLNHNYDLFPFPPSLFFPFSPHFF